VCDNPNPIRAGIFQIAKFEAVLEREKNNREYLLKGFFLKREPFLQQTIFCFGKFKKWSFCKGKTFFLR
jgi:hypothetical protein